MAWDDNTRFRITAWPAAALPHPGNIGGSPYAYNGDADALLPDWKAATEGIKSPAEPTTETYLKLAALDLADTASITEFIVTHGELDMRGDHTSYGVPDGGAFALRVETPHELEAAFQRAADVVGVGGFSDTLTEIRWAILYMRDLVSARRALSGELEEANHDWEAPLWHGMADLDSPPWTPDGRATTLSVAMQVALTPFAPRLRVVAADDRSTPFGGDDFGTWSLCCLELFNHILEAAAYKACANERCGRLFVRQEGRAAHGQYRTKGVKYCSAECARAQAQRTYRRRNRHEG